MNPQDKNSVRPVPPLRRFIAGPALKRVRMPISMISSVLGLSLLLAACGPQEATQQSESVDEGEVSSTESALVRAATTNLVPWSVMLES